MEIVRYAHLRLVDWPFRIEPDETFYRFMADRKQVRQDIGTLLGNLSRRTPSTIHLMWAWFGSGKTHTLRYIEHVCREQFDCFLPVYADFPRATRGFRDLYSLTIPRIDLNQLTAAFEEIYTHRQGGEFLEGLRFDFPDLSLVLRKLLGASEKEQNISLRWLRGEDLDRRTLREIGLGKSISSAEDAITVISWFIRILACAENSLTDQVYDWSGSWTNTSESRIVVPGYAQK